MPSSGKLSNRLIQPGLTAVVGGGAAAAVEVGMTASGGNVTTMLVGTSMYRVHTFTTSGTFTIAALGQQYNEIELLVVAGGQGGYLNSSAYGGGGAGGQVKYYGSTNNIDIARTAAAITISSTGSFTVTVGSGGSGQSGYTTGVGSGGTSSFVGGSINVTCSGGELVSSGYPSGSEWNGGIGPRTYSPTGTTYLGGAHRSYNNNAGGAGPGSGGHGGAPGSGGTASGAGPGGRSVLVKIGNDPLIPFGFGGGGAGGYRQSYYGFGDSNFIRFGGSGSGGQSGSNGVTNSGGGGGGRWNSTVDRNGGSGIVVVRYRIY